MTLPPLRKILIVDDVQRNVNLIRRYLDGDGYDIATAKDGHEALARIREDTFDLVLLDIMMPGLDGMQLCRILKSHRGTREIPIILVTALDETEKKVQALEAGADDYITKPFSGIELRARVSAMLRIKALQDDMKETNQKLREALEELQQTQSQLVKNEKLAAIQATVASVNHEINNPLCAISLDVQMLQLELKDSEDAVHRKLQRINENVKRIHGVTQQLSGLKEPLSTEFLPGQQMLDLRIPINGEAE